MKILIISRTCWDISNNFGNTFSNLFGGMNDVVIYNICCQDGLLNSSVVSNAYQMTDYSVLSSVSGKKAGHLMELSSPEVKYVSSEKAPKKRRTIYFIIRDIMWAVGRWFDSDLKQFIQEVKPDVLYLPIYASWYMCDVQNKIAKYCQVPCVGHISDDIYSYPPNRFKQPLFAFYRAILRRKLRKLIRKTAYLEVFANNMAVEYSKLFDKQCYLIGKGIDVSNWTIPEGKEKPSNPLRFIYTGNIGGGRYNQLARLGKAIDQIMPKQAILDIYTGTFIDSNINDSFSGIESIQLKGSVPATVIKGIQLEADFLVHVEDFSPQSVFETKMSFSTKIIDYMLTGRPIVAIGPAEVCSVSTLTESGTALVATSDEEILKVISNIKEQSADLHSLRKNIIKYIKENRDKDKIQEGIRNRLFSLTKQ